MRTSIIYAVIGALWILFSDRVVALLVQDAEAMMHVQTYKGWFFVGVTSLVLYFLLRTQFRLWEAEFVRRTSAVEALAESEARFRTLAEQASDGIFIADASGRCLDVNAAGSQMIGHSRAESLTMNVRDAILPEDLARLEDEFVRLAAGAPLRSQWRFKRRDGTTFHGEVNARKLPDGRLLGVVRDTTERQKLEKQLRQAQKMEAVGQLAGGVAHDFNNLLTVILGSCEMALSVTPADHRATQFLRDIRLGGERAAALTRQLLTFSRRAVLEPKVIDLNQTVHETEQLLRRLIGERVTLETRLDSSIGRVRADPGQIGQVIMNLVVNAREAMPEGGVITVCTCSAPMTEVQSAQHPGAKRGRWVRLCVADTGVGMPPEVKDRIFEPFYTTKPAGKGTGLGLSMVFGIVKQSGGHIEVETQVGKGTTFRVYFPAIEEPLTETNTPPRASVRRAADSTVLVVEDDPAVRHVAVEALRPHVGAVIQAGSGAEAIELIDRDRPKIDLLVTDVVMPEMSGRELGTLMLRRTPGLKILYASGYTDDEVIRQGILEAEVEFIQKPYTPQSLAGVVLKMLEQA